MRTLKATIFALVIGMLAFVSAPKALAQATNEKVTITFNEAVEFPGVSLPAGTYVLKVLAMGSDNIVQLIDKDEKQVYGTFSTVPVTPDSSSTAIRYSERPVGYPPRVVAWYPQPTANGEEPTNTMIDPSGKPYGRAPQMQDQPLPNDYEGGFEFIYSNTKPPKVDSATHRS